MKSGSIQSTFSSCEYIIVTRWNMDSFLNNLDSYMNKTPDRKPKGLKNQFIEKSSVVYYPINAWARPLPWFVLDPHWTLWESIQPHYLWSNRVHLWFDWHLTVLDRFTSSGLIVGNLTRILIRLSMFLVRCSHGNREWMIIEELKRDGISFKLSLIGEQYEEVPQVYIDTTLWIEV